MSVNISLFISQETIFDAALAEAVLGSQLQNAKYFRRMYANITDAKAIYYIRRKISIIIIYVRSEKILGVFLYLESLRK